MEKVTVGQLITDDNAERDAIHVAIASVVAGEWLRPGERIGFLMGDDKAYGMDEKAIGIVDPFLTARVHKGQQFYMFLLPNTITSLRHNWTHPEFDEPEVETVSTSPAYRAHMREGSTRWIAEFAHRVGLSYEDLMAGAKEWLDIGEYLNKGSVLSGESVPDEFWPHYAVVTGQVIDPEKQENFFTCSC